jgi:hypothetical protein
MYCVDDAYMLISNIQRSSLRDLLHILVLHDIVYMFSINSQSQ